MAGSARGKKRRLERKQGLAVESSRVLREAEWGEKPSGERSRVGREAEWGERLAGAS